MKLKNVLPYILIIVIVAVVLSAVIVIAMEKNGEPKSDDDELTNLTAGQFAFVEHQIQTDASLNGDNSSTSPAYAYLGYPTYNASQLQAVYASTMLPRINDSLKTIFQEGSFIGPSGCHGAQLNVDGIYHFPYTSEGDVVVLAVDGDGVAYLIYNSQPVILKPGEVWYDNQSYSDTLRSYTNPDEMVTINITVIDRITNYGIYGE